MRTRRSSSLPLRRRIRMRACGVDLVSRLAAPAQFNINHHALSEIGQLGGLTVQGDLGQLGQAVGDRIFPLFIGDGDRLAVGVDSRQYNRPRALALGFFGQRQWGNKRRDKSDGENQLKEASVHEASFDRPMVFDKGLPSKFRKNLLTLAVSLV